MSSPDLTECSTEDLVAELRDRASEVSIAELCDDDDLRAVAAQRGFTHDDERDGPLLKEAKLHELLDALQDAGEGDLLLELDLAERLGDAIARGATDEALDLLKQMAPAINQPATIKRLVAERASAGLREMLA